MTTQPITKRTWAVDKSHSSVQFSVKHMVIATVRGRFAGFDVALDADEAHPELSHLEARISADSIDTNDAKRDAHLRSADFLDASTYPVITFQSRRIEKKNDEAFDIVGDLTIHGVTREVTLATEFAGRAKDPWGAEHAGFAAHAVINRKDFDLTWNMALEAGGFLVGDTIKIDIETELVKPAP